MKSKQRTGILFAVLAAALYALSTPFSKRLLSSSVQPILLAALLYLGAGSGILLLRLFLRACSHKPVPPDLSRSDLYYVIGMVLLDIAAPILLLLGLSSANAANVSLLNNFEIVATSLFALVFFHESISGRLWIAIGLVTAACFLLSVESGDSFSFSPGSVYVLLACVCWGFENNFTKRLSEKDPLQIVIIKGFGSGAGSLIIALLLGAEFPAVRLILYALLLGFAAYGLSIVFYIKAQRLLGAAATSTWYAISPFLGAALSLLLFHESLSALYFPALAVMGAGACLAATDRPAEKPSHEN